MIRRPHVVVLPGGGYAYHADHEAEPVVEWLEGLGLEADVFRYPVQQLFPAPLDALREHIATLRRGGADPIVVLGFSAGAHLAGLSALMPRDSADQTVDAAVLCYPVVSMSTRPHLGSRTNLLGSAPNAAEQEAVSLEHLAGPDSPPLFIWHTADDGAVPVEHSYLLGGSLAAHGVPHELHVFPRGGHGMGLARGESANEWTLLCGRWLRELLG